LIDRREVMRIAKLARLELSEAEIEQYRQDLAGFLKSWAKLREVDVSQTDGTAHALRLQSVLRPDQVRVGLKQEDVLAGGPDTQDGFFRVPRIVEGQE